MKVAIIGAGDMGASCAQRIAEADLADVVILDIVKGKAQARAEDINSASSIIRHSRRLFGAVTYKDIAGAQIVVMACGQTRRPGQSRDELLLRNAEIVKDTARKIAKYCPDSIVIIVTNPLDLMTYLALKITGFATNQIIGMGGVSDCARFNMLAGAELNVASHYIQSIIIGPHSENMVILPRLSTVLGSPLTELLPQDRIAKIIEQTKEFGARIVQLLGRGSAFYGPSAGVFLLVDSIINDRKSILCASVCLCGQYGLKDLCLGVPIKLGRIGVEEIIQIKLNEKEKEEFLTSAKTVKDLIKRLGV